MKGIFLALVLICSAQTLYSQRLSTTFSNDLDRWRFEGNTFQTVFSNDLNRWNYNGIQIKTTFSNNQNNWQIGRDYELSTVFNNDFDSWEITGNGVHIRVRTTFNDDFERWDISGDINGTIRTVFSKDFQKWEIELEDEESIDPELKAAVVFIAIFTAFTNK